MRLREAFGRTALADVVSFEVFRERCPTAHVIVRAKGASAFEVGQRATSFTFLVSGRLKLVRPRLSGADSILSFVDGGTTACPVKPHERATYCCRAVAADHATRLLVLKREEAMALTRAAPEVMVVFVRMLGERAAAMCARTGELSSGSVARRVAALLLRLGRAGGEERGALRITQPLTRRDLAELVGARYETVVRCMRALEKAGVVRTRTDGFDVLDVGRLAAEAGVDPAERAG